MQQQGGAIAAGAAAMPAAPGVTPLARWTLALTGIGVFMVVLDALVVITALPPIHAEVGGDVTSLQWILTAYLLAFGAGILPAASVGDRFGRRALFVTGVALFSAASAACALAPTISLLIAARAVQGIGAALVTPLSFSLLMATFPPERRGTALGVIGGISGAAVAAGPLVGGAITQGLTWHWIFWINVPIGVVVALLSSTRIRESRGEGSRLDLPGTALIAGAGLALLWGLVQGNADGWGSPTILASLLGGGLLLAGFVVWEARAEAPLVPLAMFRSRTFASANVAGFLGLGALLAAAFFLSQFCQVVLRFTPFETGLRFLPWTAAPLVVAPFAGRLADRIGPRPLMAVGLALNATGVGLVATWATPTVSYLTLILPLMVGGIGISMFLPAVGLAVFTSVDRKDLGKASGVLNSMQRFGGAFVIAIAASQFAVSDPTAVSVGFMTGFRAALAVSVLASVIGAVVALGVSRNAGAPAQDRAGVSSVGSVSPVGV